MLGTPQIYRERNFSFRIYFNEGSEDPHVHAVRGGCVAKWWLTPVKLCWNVGFNRGELRWVQRQLLERHVFFMEQWYAVKAQAR